MRPTLIYKGVELHGWKRALTLVLFRIAALVILAFLLPIAGLWHLINGKWPPWIEFTKE